MTSAASGGSMARRSAEMRHIRLGSPIQWRMVIFAARCMDLHKNACGRKAWINDN
jgi:hypothetical protein